jgi:hypothetical protein
MTLTSTYDPDYQGAVRRVPPHRPPACSAEGFRRVFASSVFLTVRWIGHLRLHEDDVNKTARVQQLIHSHRVRALAADTTHSIPPRRRGSRRRRSA